MIAAVVLIFSGHKESVRDLNKYHVTEHLREATVVPSKMLRTNFCRGILSVEAINLANGVMGYAIDNA